VRYAPNCRPIAAPEHLSFCFTSPLVNPFFSPLLRSSLFSVVSVFISANRRNVLSAKRMGLTVVGIQGNLDGVSCQCFFQLLSLVVNSILFYVVHYDTGRGEIGGGGL
jgi:hypothetical protein